MKKTSIVITTLLVMVAAAVAVVSCKKEKLDQNANGSEQTVQNANNMDEYLMAFKKIGNLTKTTFVFQTPRLCITFNKLVHYGAFMTTSRQAFHQITSPSFIVFITELMGIIS